MVYMREIPRRLKIKGHVVEIVSDGDYGIHSFCKTCDSLIRAKEMSQIEKEKVDLMYAKSYKEGCFAYQVQISKMYDELFSELREVAKSLK